MYVCVWWMKACVVCNFRVCWILSAFLLWDRAFHWICNEVSGGEQAPSGSSFCFSQCLRLTPVVQHLAFFVSPGAMLRAPCLRGMCCYPLSVSSAFVFFHCICLLSAFKMAWSASWFRIPGTSMCSEVLFHVLCLWHPVVSTLSLLFPMCRSISDEVQFFIFLFLGLCLLCPL